MTEENKKELEVIEPVKESKKIDWANIGQTVVESTKATLEFLWKWTKIVALFIWKWILIIAPVLWKWIKVAGAFILKYSIIAWGAIVLFVKKNYKERWFQISSAATVLGIIVVAVLIGRNGNDFVPISERTENQQAIIEVSDKETTIELDALGMEVVFPEEFFDEEMSLDVRPVTTEYPTFAVEGFTFDVDLEGEHMLPGVVEMTVSYDKDMVPKGVEASDYVSAMYYNGQFWEYVYYEVNERKGEVTIKTDHFSTFGVFLGDNHKPSKGIDPIIPEGTNDTIDPATMDGIALAYAEVSRYAGIAGKVGSFADGVLELTPEAAQTVEFMKYNSALSRFNSMLDSYGKGVYYFTLAKQVYDGKTDQVLFTFLKTYGESLIGSFSNSVQKFGGAAMFAIDYSLNEFIKAAFDGAEANWEKTYTQYYDKAEYQGHNALYWRNFVLKIYDEMPPEDYYGAETYTDYINAKIDSELDKYLELIWSDLDTAYLAASDLGIGRLSVPSQTVKDKLEANYKKDLYSQRIIPAFVSVNKILDERAELQREVELQRIAHDLTRERVIYLQTNAEGTYKITDGTKVLVSGDIEDNVSYTLADYISLQSKDLYLEYTIKGVTKKASLPSEFPTGVIMEVSIEGGAEEQSNEEETPPTREEMLIEWELDFDSFIEREEEILETTYTIVVDAYNNSSVELISSVDQKDSYKAETSEGTMYLTVSFDEEEHQNNFGFAYEKLYYFNYLGHQVNLDDDFHIVSMYTHDEVDGIDYGKWNDILEHRTYYLNGGDTYTRHFNSDGSVRAESYYFLNGDVYEIFYDQGEISKIRINGDYTYPE